MREEHVRCFLCLLIITLLMLVISVVGYTDNHDAAVKQARLLIGEDKCRKALELLQTALKMDPLNSTAMKYYSKAAATLHGATIDRLLSDSKRHKKSKDYTSTMKSLVAAREIDPFNKKAISMQKSILEHTEEGANQAWDRAMKLTGEKKYDQAMAEYKKAIRLNPFFVEAHNNLGELYYRKGHYDQAMACFNCGYRIDTKDAIVLNNLASIHDSLGNYREAIDYWKLFQKQSKDEFLKSEVGKNILTAQGRLLRREVKEKPQDFALRLELIENYLERSKPDRALREIGKARELNPKPSDSKKLDDLQVRADAANKKGHTR
jgi:tetratricopeptide (TPR) repeat protein